MLLGPLMMSIGSKMPFWEHFCSGRPNFHLFRIIFGHNARDTYTMIGQYHYPHITVTCCANGPWMTRQYYYPHIREFGLPEKFFSKKNFFGLMNIIRGPINTKCYIYMMVMSLSYYYICSTSTVSKNNPKLMRIGSSRAKNVPKMALLA